VWLALAALSSPGQEKALNTVGKSKAAVRNLSEALHSLHFMAGRPKSCAEVAGTCEQLARRMVASTFAETVEVGVALY